MTDALVAVVQKGLQVFDLSRPLFTGMPQSPNHPKYSHTLPRRHGDMVRADGGSAANDLIIMGTHVGTHIDALAHVSQDGMLYGGANATDSCIGGGYQTHGVHTIEPMILRGVLLDIPRALGVEVCEPAYEITPDDLERAIKRQGTDVNAGDVVLIRSGWGRRFDEGAEAYLGHAAGVPGVGQAGAQWLADRGVIAAGADTIAFERLAPGAGHSLFPAHRILLVESGIYIIEALDLETLADSAVTAFTFILIPMKLVGATGSPVRPLAVVSRA